MNRLDAAVSIDDLRRIARRRLPRVMFDYIDGGAEDCRTQRWNRDAFARYEFVPRVLTDVSEIDLSTTVQGVPVGLPVISAPTGMSRMFHWQGERAVVRATHRAGAAYTLSTVATTSIEEVAKASQGPLFFQIYAWRNRDMVFDFIDRCQRCGYAGLMLAVDLAALGKRERDLRNGHGIPSRLRRNTARTALIRPAWLYRFLSTERWTMANMIDHLPQGAEALKVIDTVNEQFSPAVTWQDAREIQQRWDGRFLLKGIQSVADAVRAAEMGVHGIILSNHGGRQLDGAPAPLDLLPEVVQAVGTDVEVWIDGGIHRGSDVIKAIALGARAVMIGRAYLYGLAAGGEAGVARAYAILREEMERVLKLLGCPRLADLDPSFVRRRSAEARETH